jgi:DNA-binding transcriptional regulator YiaG
VKTTRRAAGPRSPRGGPSLATLIKAELTQLAARANRAIHRRVTRLQRQARALRRANLEQRRGLARLERGVARLREAGHSPARAASGPGVRPAAVRALRSRLGMTRERFARHLGVSPGSIFLWESGRARPRAASLARLRKAQGGAPGGKAGATRRRRRTTASRTRAARGR